MRLQKFLLMPVFWLEPDRIEFPNPHFANEDGIVAIGGDLSPERLLLAYRIGLFPWFNADEPILWWSLDPRLVLFPKDLYIAKSMRPYFNQQKFKVTFDRHFEQVVRACQQNNRKNQQNGTWISEDIVQAYTRMHELGHAHSVEVWQGQDLVGGLYGMAIGNVFFGESMFAEVSNASKVGFITLVQKLTALGYWMIDCQQQTQHLTSMGAVPIKRTQFLKILKKNEAELDNPTSWKHW
jgi:leucyl/phenylalanyl-tRNA---protein transferase